MKPKTIERLEENVEKITFLDITQKAQAIKKKNNKLDFIKTKLSLFESHY